jgi:hypothetical protein
MGVLGWILFLVVGVSLASAVVYVVWRILDRQDVDALRQQMEGLESRMAAIEAARPQTPQ